MHATIEQLLEIKDGVQNDASLHVGDCQRCQQELTELAHLRQEIYSLANQKPGPELWGRIKQSASNLDNQESPVRTPLGVRSGEVPLELLVANSQQTQYNSLSKAVYSLAASILVTGFIGFYMLGQQGDGSSQNQILQASIQELMFDSRGMERALQKASINDDMLTVSEQSMADRLYWRLAYLDQIIHDNDLDATDSARIEALWNERVDTLTELNQLYYQRQQALDDSEI